MPSSVFAGHREHRAGHDCSGVRTCRISILISEVPIEISSHLQLKVGRGHLYYERLWRAGEDGRRIRKDGYNAESISQSNRAGELSPIRPEHGPKAGRANTNF